MKLLLEVYSGSRSRLVSDLLDAHHVGGYTGFEQAHGAGTTGRREGTRAWPGDSTVYFTIVAPERVDALTAALREEAARLEPLERLHVAVLPTETFF
jgi:hypothetical protein